MVDPAPVELDLRLTGAARAHALTAGRLATGLAGHRLTPAAQARQQVLQLGQLDLRLALLGLRVLGEDVEDQRGAVDDLDLDDVLEGAPLAGGQLGVADHRVGALGDDDVAQLLGLAGAEVGAGVRLRAALHESREDRRARRLGESGELAHRVVGVLGGAVGPDGGQHDPLKAQLAVLDLGDVLELGRQPRDAAQRCALLAVELLAVIAEAVVGVVAVQVLVGQGPSARWLKMFECVEVISPLGSHQKNRASDRFMPTVHRRYACAPDERARALLHRPAGKRRRAAQPRPSDWPGAR